MWYTELGKKVKSYSISILRLFNETELFSFFASHSFSIVLLPSCFCKSSISMFLALSLSLNSCTALAGSNASEAFSKNCFFHFIIDWEVILYFEANSAIVWSSFRSSNAILVFCSALYVWPFFSTHFSLHLFYVYFIPQGALRLFWK